MRHRRFLNSMAAAITALSYGGCGYHTAGHFSTMPKNVRVIAVPAMENKTSTYRVEQKLTAATIHEFLAKTKYRVVSDANGGDAVLTGKVLRMEVVPLLFQTTTTATTSTAQATAMLVTMTCEVTLTDRATDKVLYHNADFVFRNEYELSTDVRNFFQEGDPALDRMAQDFAARLVAAVTENFLMARVSTEEFLERLQKGKPVPAVLLLGDEPYLRDECRKQLIEKYVPEAARTWAISRFSADNGETQAAVDQSQTLPMLSPTQVVFLEEGEAIEKLGEKARDEAVKTLEAYLENPAPFTVLVIEASGLDQRMRLAKLLMEKALVVEVGLGENLDERVAAAAVLAKSLAKEQGIEFEKGAAEDLAESVSGDLMRLKTEVDKLATFATERKSVRRQDVAALVISEKSATIWEVADFLAARQPQRALEFFARLLREGEEPVAMLGAMAWMYRKLIEASEVRGATNGWQAAKALGMRPEQAELAIQNARKISKERLLDGLKALREADDRLKGGTKDPHSVMEFLVWQ